MSLSQQEYYTYSNYATWDHGKRCELIDGVIHMMAPAPSQNHQEILGSLFIQIGNFLTGKPCKLFVAPFDVRLNAAGDQDDTVVQPDILVVCDRSKLDGKGCNGAPDMVIEVLSPSTASYDKVVKFKKYLQAGVREYWMVDPDSKTVQACILHDGEYLIRAYHESDVADVHILEGCKVNLQDVFTE